MTPPSAFPQWLHAGAPPSALLWVSRWFCMIWLVKLWLVPLEQVVWLPVEMATPLFPLTLLSEAAFHSFLQNETLLRAIHWVTAALLCGALFTRDRVQGALLLPAAVFLTIFTALIRVYGHVNHSDLALLLCTWVLALEGGALWIVRSSGFREKRAERVLMSMTAVFCMTYLLIGSHRLLHGGIALFSGPALDHWLIWRSSIPGLLGHSLGLSFAAQPLLMGIAKGLFALATVAEVVAPLALVSPLFRRFVVAVMLPMHAGILLLMNIAFFENMAMFILFIPMGRTSKSPCVILFDGVCNFCDRFVRLVIPRDPERLCFFAPSQSDAGRELMRRHDISPEAVVSSIQVIEEGRVLTRSAAFLAVVARLSFPWRLLAWGRLIPVPVRDWLYDLISANRYRWFGKRSECRLPTPEERSRFLQEADVQKEGTP